MEYYDAVWKFVLYIASLPVAYFLGRLHEEGKRDQQYRCKTSEVKNTLKGSFKLSEKTYATNFKNSLSPTHAVVNVESKKEILLGTKAECLAFLHGLEYTDNSTDSAWDQS